MECPYCNAENRDGVHFCSNCGKPLTPAITASSTSAGSANINSRLLTPGSRLQGGRYIIKKMLGQGGMGAAMLATDIRLDSKSVVLKELISDNTDPARLQEDVRNFKREVATLAHLDHPLIPNVTDHFQEGSRYFMVQEYAEGENLEERMDRVNQPMMEREALGYTSEVVDIFDYLSQETPPIVHRDIKPANIIVGTKDKRAHLVDFGIARADETRNAQRKQTSALGTPGYAPPEQYQGNADPRSDLYALAATLHHVLTNRDPRNYPPFAYPPVRSLNAQLSPDTERVLSRELTNDVNQRYQSAAAMKRDIDDILQRRYGIAGNTSSYMLGNSGVFSAVVANTATTPATLDSSNLPTVSQVPTQVSQSTLTPIPPVPPYNMSPPATPPPSYYQPPPISSVPPPPKQSKPRRSPWLLVVVLLVLLALILGGVFAFAGFRNTGTYNSGNGKTQSTPTKAPATISGVGVTEIGNELIGVSDGSYSFDSGRADGQ